MNNTSSKELLLKHFTLKTGEQLKSSEDLDQMLNRYEEFKKELNMSGLSPKEIITTINNYNKIKNIINDWSECNTFIYLYKKENLIT